jgi:hypothetical protein
MTKYFTCLIQINNGEKCFLLLLTLVYNVILFILNYSQPHSFRPITLSSFIMKTLERVVLWHMLETTLALRPMCDKQHAFYKQMVTDTALLCMAECIEQALVDKRFALGVFFGYSRIL